MNCSEIILLHFKLRGAVEMLTEEVQQKKNLLTMVDRQLTDIIQQLIRDVFSNAKIRKKSVSTVLLEEEVFGSMKIWEWY